LKIRLNYMLERTEQQETVQHTSAHSTDKKGIH
jgi:hypothetical protein